MTSKSSIENAEQNVIGSMMKNFHLLQTGMETVNANFFSDVRLRDIFQTLKKKVYDEKKDYININLIIHNISKFSCTSPEFIKSIFSNASILDFKANLDIVVEEHKRRNLQILLQDMLKLTNGVSSIDDLLELLIHKSTSFSCEKKQPSILSIKDVFSSTPYNLLLEIQKIQENPDQTSRKTSPTGFSDLDKIIGGATLSNLIILAARPSMGKTALALNIGLNISKLNVPIGFISLEMGSDQLAYRLLASESSVPATDIVTGKISKTQFHSIQAAARSLSSLPIYFEEANFMTLDRLAAAVRKMKHIYNIKVLFIDYLQLLTATKKISAENRQQEISTISRSIKLLAHDLNICIICLSQLSRKVEERPDKTPKMSDLRESGSIEQDADQVILLYRPEYYTSTQGLNSAEHPTISIPQLIISKNRNGCTGSIRLSFRPNILKFTGYEEVPIAINDSLEEDFF